MLIKVMINVDLNQARFHTFTRRCWKAPCAVDLAEESLGPHQQQPSVTDIGGVL